MLKCPSHTCSFSSGNLLFPSVTHLCSFSLLTYSLFQYIQWAVQLSSHLIRVCFFQVSIFCSSTLISAVSQRLLSLAVLHLWQPSVPHGHSTAGGIMWVCALWALSTLLLLFHLIGNNIFSDLFPCSWSKLFSLTTFMSYVQVVRVSLGCWMISQPFLWTLCGLLLFCQHTNLFLISIPAHFCWTVFWPSIEL